MKIMLDAGHGGHDSGATGNGLKEKEITLYLAMATGDYLVRNYACDVVYTRISDSYVSLEKRARMANTEGVNFFCSIHVNSATNTNARGFESFTYPKAVNKTVEMQRILHDSIVETITMQNRGKKQKDLFVLRETKMAAILTEVLFISNQQDSALLANTRYLDNIAKAHAIGIAKACRLRSKLRVLTKGRYRIMTGTFSDKETAEYHAERLRQLFDWKVYVQEEKN